MALSNKKVLGSWKPANNAVLRARTFDNGSKYFATQVITEFPDAFVVRGRGILDANNNDHFTLASGITTEDITALEASNSAGLNTPSTWSTPAGYVQKFTTDGTPYYVNSADLLEYEKGDTDGDGVSDNRSTNLFTSIGDWLGASTTNKVIAACVVVGIFLLVKNMGSKGRRKSSFLGLL